MITPKFYDEKKIDEIYLPRFGEIKEAIDSRFDARDLAHGH